MTESSQVDAYLTALPDDQRDALEHLRRQIKAIAPDAIEGLSYGVPAFKLNKKSFVSFGAGKGHCAFYVQSPAVMEAHADDLKGYDTAKGTVRFKPDAPLPDDLLRKLVLARVDEVGTPAKKR